MTPIIAIDFETFYSSKLKYSLTGMHAEQYCASPLFDPYMVSLCDGVNAWAGHPKDCTWESLDGAIFLSHNKAFDSTVWARMKVLGLIPASVNPSEWHCTANLTSYICNRRALAESVEYLFKVKLDKSARSDANNKHWPQDFNAAEQATMLHYAKDDALWCWKLWNTYSKFWPEHERRLSNLTIEQGQHGVQINAALLNEYIMQSHALKLATESKLPWMVTDEGQSDFDWDDFNPVPTSTKCIAEQCRRSGIPCPPIKAREGAEAFDEWEALHSPAHPWIAAMSAWRSVNKLLKTLQTAKSRLRADGTMPFDLKYFGAHTGRWSGGSKLNFQNFRKVPIFVRKSDGLMETDEKQIAAAAKQEKKSGTVPDWVLGKPIDFRRLITPRPGMKMITSDLSQIEPRVEATICQDEKLLALIRSGYGVYEAFARANMGWTAGDLKDEDPDRYQLTKIQVLGLGFGCGWEKFIAIAAGYGIDLTADDPKWIEEENPFTGEIVRKPGYGKRAREIVKAFRENNPKIVALWKKLDDAFKQSVGADFTLRMPSGRALKYERVRCETRLVSDENGKLKRKSVFTAEIGSRRVPTYGGSLTENLVQATARDVFGHHLLRLVDTPGIRVLFTAHDEAICECSPDVTAEQVRAIMRECPEWLPGCPVDADAKEVAHYLK